MPTKPILVDSLRTFVRDLKKRPDIKVESAVFGKKAPAALLKGASARPGSALGGELLAFYAAVNGVEIRWSFIEGPGGGLIHIPPLSDGRRFQGEDKHHMGFGVAQEALFLDGTGDGGAWVVRAAGSSEPGEIVFAMAAEGTDGVRLGSSLETYLLAAIAAGGVVNWPFCQGAETGAFRASEASLRKFKAPPVKPLALRPGVRVQVRALAKEGRGEMIESRQIEAGVLRPWETAFGFRFVKVNLDVGITAWVPEMYVKAVQKTDAYERLRGRLEGEDVAALLEDVACATGPSGSTNDFNRDNAMRGAGLLGPYAIAKAFEVVFGLLDAALAQDLDLLEPISLEGRTRDLFLASDYSTSSGCYRREDPLIALIGGFQLLLTEAAVAANASWTALLTPAMSERLHAYGAAGSEGVSTEIRSLKYALKEPPRPVSWSTHSRDIAARIGLDPGELLLTSS